MTPLEDNCFMQSRMDGEWEDNCFTQSEQMLTILEDNGSMRLGINDNSKG